MKVTAYLKDCFRTIRRERKRFLAILIITVLGVAMFSGLKASCEDLRHSADVFFDQQKLHDLSIQSTLGLTSEDVTVLTKLPGVEYAEGFYAETVTANVGAKNVSISLELLSPSGMDRPYLLEGRMPERADEAVVTEKFLREAEARIGDVLVIEEELDPGDEDKDPEKPTFGNTVFTITGSVVDVRSINNPNGATSFRSSTTADETVFVLPSAADTDIFTSVNLVMEGASELFCYGSAYQDKVHALKEFLEREVKAQREKARYEEVTGEAYAELEKAEKEASEKLADAELELKDGEETLKEELADAQAELLDARKELEDGRKELADGWKEYEDGKDKASREFARAREELADGKRQLAEAKELLKEKEAELMDGRAELEAARREAETGLLQLADGLDQIDEGLTQVEPGISQIEDGLSQMDDGLSQLEDGISQLAGGISQLEAGISQIDDGLLQLELALAAGYLSEEEYQMQKEGSLFLRSQLSSEKDQLLARKEELLGQEEELLTQKEALEQQRKELGDTRDALLAQKAELSGKKEEVEQGLFFLQEKMAEVEAGQQQLEAGKTELSAREAELLAGEAELTQKEAETAQSLADARQELADGEAELADGEEKLADGWKEYYEGKAEGEEKLADGWKEYYEGKAEAEEKLADARAEIEDIEMTTWYLWDRNNMDGYLNVGSDADAIESIGTVFPIIFFLVAIMISLTTVTRMVEEDRSLIGTYKALGFTNREIRRKYILYASSACLSGGLVGTLAAFLLLPCIVILIFRIMYLLPAYHYTFLPLYGLAGPFLFLAGILAATLSACQSELVQTPASLMRPKTPRAGSRVILENIPWLWERMSFLNKVTARNLFRYKKRLFMTIFGIAGCMALLLFGFAIKDSVDDLIPRQYDQTFHYDLLTAVAFPKDNDRLLEHLDQTEGIADYVNIQIAPVTLQCGESDELSAQIVVVPEDAQLEDFVSLKSLSGETLTLKDGDIYVTRNAGIVLGFGDGDLLHVQFADLTESEVTVTAMVENYLSNYLFLTEDTYREWFGEFEPNGAFAHLTEQVTDSKAFALEFKEKDKVVTSVSVQGFRDDFSVAFLLILMVVYVVIIMSAALAFVVLFTLSTTNISERERELATIKVLGFFDSEVHAYVNKETYLLTGIGILLGIPLGYAFAQTLSVILDIPAIYLATSLYPRSYLFAAVLTMLFALVVNLISGVSLNKINPAIALKSIE